jgi:hypothetical protein
MNTNAYPILLVEDSPDDALLIQRAFRKANLANRCSSSATARRRWRT